MKEVVNVQFVSHIFSHCCNASYSSKSNCYWSSHIFPVFV